MADRLNAVDRDILRAIANLTDQLGWAPSYREVADAVGIGVSTVHDRLVLLEQTGWVRRAAGQPRALAVVKRP